MTRPFNGISEDRAMGLPEPPELGTSALPAGTYDGQVVIVTGGGTGLGKAMAVEFARLGASIAVLSRKKEHRQAGVAAIESVGAKAAGIACDIRQPEQIAEAFDAVEGQLGAPSVLVNNAAGNFPVPAEDMSPNAWRTVIDIVLNGTFYCSREFGRRHIAAGTPASIVNIGAAYAWTGGPGFAHSAAGKAGVKNMTETLAVEWGPYGIRVNALVPGLFPHDDEVQAIRSVPERRKNDGARSPAMRVGYPHELGWAATFLASPYAAYISGHTLVVDGANWQRRAMLMPEFVPIREQLGKGPFELD
jgi:NAD(P)-dependent dehydrogenase (short-subunit alcohol dehydrogenase family)